MITVYIYCFSITELTLCFRCCRSVCQWHNALREGKRTHLCWHTNWKHHHCISMRSKTTLAQRLPADMEDKVIQFHRFILRLRQRWGYDLSRILNMGETPMHFELPATRTLEFTGSRTVPVFLCGADKHGRSGGKSKWRKTSPKGDFQRATPVLFRTTNFNVLYLSGLVKLWSWDFVAQKYLAIRHTSNSA